MLRALPWATVLLAGCLAPALDGPPPGAEVVEAPAWPAGKEWKYDFLADDGRVAGYRAYRVEGTTTLANRTVYELREEAWTAKWFDHATNQSPPRVRSVHRDVATLDEVWDECGKPFLFGACRGVGRSWNFPLWEGKRWGFPSGGDVIVDYEARVEKAGERWRIVIVPEGPGFGSSREVWTYSPADGVMELYERTAHDGSPGEGGLRLVRS